MKNSWLPVSLLELARPVERRETPNPGKRYRQIGVRLWGEGAYERESIDGGQTRYRSLSRVESDDIIVNKIWARNGSVAVVSSQLSGCYGSNEFPTFAPIREKLEPRWFHWYTKTKMFWDQCDEKSRGTSGKNRIRPEKFLEIQIPFPPISEQRRIVARIEELAAKIEEARGLRQQTIQEVEALWPSVLSSAFRPSTNGRYDKEKTAVDLLKEQAETYSSAPKPKHNNAHPWKPNIYSKGPYELPSHWVWTDLGSVLTQLVDCINDTPDFSTYSTGLLGLKSTNIRAYRLDLSQRWFMSSEDFARWNRREQPQGGDIVLTREAPMGNACILPGSLPVCLTQRLMLLRTDEAFIRRRYLLHYLNSPCFRDQVSDQCRGLTTPHIRVQDAPFLRIPLAPLLHQDQVVGFLDDLHTETDRLSQSQSETAAELDAMLPSILDKAFKGNL